MTKPPFEYQLTYLYPMPRGVGGGCVGKALKKIKKHPGWSIPDFVVWDDVVKTIKHLDGCVYRIRTRQAWEGKTVSINEKGLVIEGLLFEPPFLLGLVDIRNDTEHMEAILHPSELDNYAQYNAPPIVVAYIITWWEEYVKR